MHFVKTNLDALQINYYVASNFNEIEQIKKPIWLI